jgi:hypothetical protein
MEFIVDHVREFDHVHDADRDAFIKRFAGTAVEQDGLAVRVDFGFFHDGLQFIVVDAVENGGGELDAEFLGGHAEVDFQDLADVHTRRNAERVQHDVDLGAIGQERHIFDREDLGDDAFVSVTSGHLVAFGDLTFLDDVDAHDFVDAGRQFILLRSV